MVAIARGAAGVVLVGMGLVVCAAVLLPRLVGWSAFVVTSGSMSPTFGPGALVVTAPVEPNDLEMRDIVTFADPDGFTTHRIVGMQSASVAGQPSRIWVTKGDGNEDPDPTPLDAQNIVGKAKFAVPHLGYLVEFVKAPLGAGLLAALFLFVVFSGGGSSKQREPTRRTAEEPSDREAVAIP